MVKAGLIFILTSMLVLAACAPPDTQLTPAPPIPAQGVPSPAMTGSAAGSKAVFQDDFANPGSGWDVGQADANRGGKYENGAYTYWVNSQGAAALGNRSIPLISDFTLEVDVARVPGGKSGQWSVWFRNDGKGNILSFGFTDDGNCCFARATGGKFSRLTDWTPSSEIKTDGQMNHVKIVCAKSRQEAYINGSRVAYASDNLTTKGIITFGCGSGDADGAKYTIDNVRIYDAQ